MTKNIKLEKLVEFYEKNSRMPSFSEMQKLWGFRSKNAVYKLVNKFSDEGLIKRDKGGKILPTGYFSEIPILGSVEAGFPSPAEEETHDTMNLDEYLITRREATFVAHVSGDSMIDAGIMPGDMLLVERGRDPRDGDIVLARIDNGCTLKYFRKNKSGVYLEAANRKYKPFYPKNELKIEAVVTVVIRKYKI